MEPPAKRPRLMPSVEVDESNPDYVAAQEKIRLQLKSRFESIFAKFEAVPEAMSDEINMRTGEIVVDRGHYRKLDREYRRKRGQEQLLDEFLMGEVEGAQQADANAEEDTRDELAPSQSPEPQNRSARIKKFVDRAPSPPAPTHSQINAPSPITPYPAANLTQLMPFAQVPTAQDAQTPFMAQLTQAVQQAITPIISKFLADKFPAMGVPTGLIEQAVPATDTRWIRSSPPGSSHVRTVAPSSPAPILSENRRRRGCFAKGVYIKPRTNTQTGQAHNEHQQSNDEPRRVKHARRLSCSPSTSRHLPTPSSLEHHEVKDTHIESADDISTGIEEVIASRAHFDDEELELLSLASSEDHPDEPAAEDLLEVKVENDDHSGDESDPADAILPSIELDTSAVQDKTAGLGNDTESAPNRPDIPPKVGEPVTSPFTTKRIRPTQGPPNFQVDSDSEIDLNLVNASSPILRKAVSNKSRRKSLKTKDSLKTHEQFLDRPNPTAHPAAHSPTPDASTQADELFTAAPHSPIKRETCTPPSTLLFLTPALKTPTSAPHPLTANPSADHSSTKLSRSAYLQKVKSAWAKNGRKSMSTPKSAARRQSAQMLPRKRAWDEGDSEDELAL